MEEEDIDIRLTQASIKRISTANGLRSSILGSESRLSDRKWRLSTLKKEFQTINLIDLFESYTDKVHHGYFSLYLILQTLLSGTHFFVLMFSVYDINEYLIHDIPDLILYLLTTLLALVGVVTIDRLVKRLKKWQKLQYLAFGLVFFTNIFVPIYHYYVTNLGHFRPAYTTLLVIWCYVFFSVFNNVQVVFAGGLVSLSHIVTLSLITYQNSSKLWQKVVSDLIFQICINAFGIYFRYMNEIVIRRSFLDKRECVFSKYNAIHEKEQARQLLSSVLPSNIVNKVVSRNFQKLENFENKNDIPRKLSMSNKFFEPHDNITVLFADIVHYTEMTKKLDILELLKTLNDLFCSFDDASEEFKVTRIKFLGDCYYCAAGLPPSPPANPAEACVDLGLKMISIIARVREKRDLNVNMRIGIHTGKIYCGIIGEVKYQFDIWSKDVNIANAMETEGSPGKVHITNQTYNLLKKKYNVEQTDKGETVPYFKKENIQTYLISPNVEYGHTPSILENLQSNTNHEEILPRRTSLFQKRAPSGTLLHQMKNSPVIEESEEIDPPQRKSRNSSVTFIEQNSGIETSESSKENIEETSSPKRSRSSGLTFIEENTTIEPSEDTSSLPKRNRSSGVTFIEEEYNIQTDGDSSSPKRSRSSAVTFIEDSEGSQTSRESTISSRGRGDDPEYNSANRRRRTTVLQKGIEKRRQTEQSGRNTAFMSINCKRFNERFAEANNEMESEIEQISFSKYKQFVRNQYINVLMFFRDKEDEWEYMRLPDPLFKYYIISEVFVLICVYLIQNLTLSSWDTTEYSIFLTLGIVLLVFIPITWAQHIYNKVKSPKLGEIPENKVFRFFYNLSKFITNSFWARLVIYVTASGIFSYTVLTEVIECNKDSGDNMTKKIFLRLLFENPVQAECVIPWHLTETCALAFIMTFLFLRMFIWIKFFILTIITVIYSYCVYEKGFYQHSDTFNYYLNPQLAHIICVVFITITLQLIDRQTDYMNRQDFLWNKKLQIEQFKADLYQKINKDLVNNILPEHVAEMYMDKSRQIADELYYERHENVAVMFASLIYDQDDDANEDQFLEQMNTYITEFDLITKRDEFKSIEKIKIAKWTYMVACGLSSFETDKKREGRHIWKEPIIQLVMFASEMMKSLKKCNGIYHYKLRIGISHGAVAAGVVGSKKPLYDIWGDAVNMASRMDSKGIPNKIQVMKNTAEVIMKHGYKCEYRGDIEVKGAPGPVATYFVILNEDNDLVRIQDSEGS